MKILFDHPFPFALAHGGFQVQIEQTRIALQKVQVQADYVRWWDDQQSGDIIHYFGRPSVPYIQAARDRGIKVVLAELLTELGSRSALARAAQKSFIVAAQKILPEVFTMRMGWESFREANACVALTQWEARLMVEMFRASPEGVHVIPNGVEDVFLEEHSATRGKWLVCTATIADRKRVLELAEVCVSAGAPVWIIGKPQSTADPYAVRFLSFVKQHSDLVRYEGPIGDRKRLAEAYRQARGFVLLSAWESLSLSALEAGACGCPLLLSDLPWARTVFGDQATYCPIGSAQTSSAVLRKFYADAPNLKPPNKPKRWVEVAQQLKTVYESLLRTS